MTPHTPNAKTLVSSVLLTADDLGLVPQLTAEYARKQEEALKEFQSVSSQQRRSTEAALDNLKTARASIANLSSLFMQIIELCDKPADTALGSFDSQLLKKLATVHSNIDQTYRSTETVAGLPEAALKAEAMISDMNLVDAHLYLSQVEATVYRIKHALDGTDSADSADSSTDEMSLEPYFDRVRVSMTKIEHKLWWIVRSFMEPELDRRALVAALQVIETQELVDSKLVADGLGDCPLRKGWRHRCMQNMSNAISERTVHVLQRCSKILSDEGEGSAGGAGGEALSVRLGEALRDVLGEAGRILRGMTVAVDRVEMCFPERYRIREFVRNESRAFKESVLEILGGYSEDMSNGDILFVLDWAADAGVDGRAHGAPAADGVDGVDGVDGAAVAVFADRYLSRMDRALRNWLKNILTADFEGEPKSDKKGQLFTPGPQDMFRLIEEQERFVGDNAMMRAGVRRRIRAILKEFLIEEYRRRIDVEENLEVLCAVCNNLLLLDDLLSEYKLDGFKQRARDAAVRCGRVVFLDPGFAELFGGFFADDEGWKKAGARTGSLMATLEDFMADFRVWLGPSSAVAAAAGDAANAAQAGMGDVCVKEVVDGCCRYYVASLLSGLNVIDSAAIDRMDDDLSRMRDKLGNERNERNERNVGLDVIEGIREFFASDSVESFVIGWSSLLDSGGLGGPALGLVQGLVHKRVDLTRSDCREILAALQELPAMSAETVNSGSLEGFVAIQEANEGLRRDAQFSTAWRGLRW